MPNNRHCRQSEKSFLENFGNERNFGMEPLFQELQNEAYDPIAIYGMGVNAESLLKSSLESRIRFVIAKDHIGEAFHGYEVKAIEDVLPLFKTIIIAASPRVTGIIYDRISSMVPNEKHVFNMYGVRLNGRRDYTENICWNQTFEGLLRAIDAHDVISFDCFDTLFMRRTLQPKDIFEVLGEQVDDDLGISFASWRIEAEQAATAEHPYPTLAEIYESMEKLHRLREKDGAWLMEQELAMERMAICPRESMIEAFRYAIRQGKAVYVTTDTYFSSDFVEALLKDSGIEDGYVVLASCECRASKADGSLYDILLSRTGQRSILHVGDNRLSDGIEAEQHHLDTFPVLSAFDMLRDSSCGFICEHLHGLDDRNVLGNILAEVLNNPFALSASKGKMAFHDAGSLAMMCHLPLVQGYLSFLLRIVRGKKEGQNSKVLFVSRDGYFLKKVYDNLRKQDSSLPESIYFYTSREAMTKSVCCSEKDIDVLLSDLSQLDNLSLKHVLHQRFHVDFDEVPDGVTVRTAYETWGEHKIRKVVFSHKKEIFSKAVVERGKYRFYLDSIHLNDEPDAQIFLVDLCTRGTVAYGLRQMLGRPVHLIAMGGLFLPNAYVDREEDYSLYLGVLTPFINIFSLFGVLELLLASREGQVAGFDRDGAPVFTEDSAYRRELLDGVQGRWKRELESPWMQNLLWWNMELSLDFVKCMMEVIRPECSDVDAGICSLFDFTDPLSTTEKMNALEKIRG